MADSNELVREGVNGVNSEKEKNESER